MNLAKTRKNSGNTDNLQIMTFIFVDNFADGGLMEVIWKNIPFSIGAFDELHSMELPLERAKA